MERGELYKHAFIIPLFVLIVIPRSATVDQKKDSSFKKRSLTLTRTPRSCFALSSSSRKTHTHRMIRRKKKKKKSNGPRAVVFSPQAFHLPLFPLPSHPPIFPNPLLSYAPGASGLRLARENYHWGRVGGGNKRARGKRARNISHKNRILSGKVKSVYVR